MNKNYADLIEGALTDFGKQQDDAVEPISVDTILLNDVVQTYIQQGYQLRMVTADDDGKRVVMMVKGNMDSGMDVKYLPLDDDDAEPDIMPALESYKPNTTRVRTYDDIDMRIAQKGIDKKASLVSSWLRSWLPVYDQVSIKKKSKSPEPLEPRLEYYRWELNWNNDKWLIITVGTTDPLNDLTPNILIGIDGRGLLKGNMKAAKALQRAARRGYRNYNEFRDLGLELTMEYFPEWAIPTEEETY